MNSFSVCALIQERPFVIERFVSHYQRVGAEQIFIYFDGDVPNKESELIKILDNNRVSHVVCDAEFWHQKTGETSPALSTKIVAAFRDAIPRNRSDWVLFCDVDELVVGNCPLGHALAQLPTDVFGVRLRNTEAVWCSKQNTNIPFSCNYERSPFPAGRLGQTVLPMLVYGRAWRVMRRGTTGHTSGKHLLRRGVFPDEMTSHSSVVEGKAIRYLHEIIPNHLSQRILHFDAISQDRWVEKWRKRIQGRTISTTMGLVRQQQMARIAEALNLGHIEREFRRYNSLNSWQLKILGRLGLADRIPQHIKAMLQARTVDN